MEDYLDLGNEADFVNSFSEAEQVFDYLKELHDEYELLDISGIKQAFLEYEMHFHYMECIKFEEIYLK